MFSKACHITTNITCTLLFLIAMNIWVRQTVYQGHIIPNLKLINFLCEAILKVCGHTPNISALLPFLSFLSLNSSSLCGFPDTHFVQYIEKTILFWSCTCLRTNKVKIIQGEHRNCASSPNYICFLPPDNTWLPCCNLLFKVLLSKGVTTQPAYMIPNLFYFF